MQVGAVLPRADVTAKLFWMHFMMFLVVDGGPLGWVDVSVYLIMTSRLKNSLDYGKKFGIATAKGCPCVAGKHSRVLVLVFIQVVTSQK